MTFWLTYVTKRKEDIVRNLQTVQAYFLLLKRVMLTVSFPGIIGPAILICLAQISLQVLYIVCVLNSLGDSTEKARRGIQALCVL